MKKYESLVDILQQHKSSTQQLVFCNNVNNEKKITYQTLYRNSLKQLQHLTEKGVSQGDQLIFQVQDNYQFVVTFWACILGGIIAVPISVGAKKENLKKVFSIWNILERPRLCYDQASYLTNLTSYGEQVGLNDIVTSMNQSGIDLNEISHDDAPPTPTTLLSIPADDIAFIQFSSGSTGNPKGVVLTHRNLVANVKAIAKAAEISVNDTMISWMPLTHDMGLIAVHLTGMLKGIKQVLINTPTFIRKPALWLDKTSLHRGTLLYTPNYGLKFLLDAIKGKKLNWDLSCVRLIFNGAEPISLDLAENFLKQLAEYKLPYNSMYPVYGLAEACVAVSFPKPSAPMQAHHLCRKQLNYMDKVNPVERNAKNAVTFLEVGQAINECEIKVADEKGNILPDYHIGLIYIKGTNVTSGYFHDTIATEKVLHNDGWLNTGDLGFLYNNQLIITGRAKDIIIINGQNYYAHDIEQLCMGIQDLQLRDIVATSHADDSGIESLIIFIRYKKDLASFITLSNKIKQHIHNITGLTIKDIIPIKSIPKTTSGKVRRFELQQQYAQDQYLNTLAEIRKASLPASDLSELNNVSTSLSNADNATNSIKIKHHLSNELLQLLGYIPDNLQDKFSDHGIDSLKAVELRNALQNALNIDIPVSATFDYPTLQQLIDYLTGLLAQSPVKPNDNNHCHEPTQQVKQDNIAIIGFAGQFPGGQFSADEFFETLLDGYDLSSLIPSERWSPQTFYHPGNKPGFSKTQHGYFLKNIEQFDAGFFNITPIEAQEIDPQQRLLLMLAQYAIDHAGIKNESLNGSNTGVYIGLSNSDYAHQTFQDTYTPHLKEHSLTGCITSTASGRIAYHYGLQGPCLTLDTACSSSLVGIDLARSSLLAGQCDMALVGGINLMLTPQGYVSLSKVNALSPDGKCKVFDEQADGYGRGEGGAVLILKRLSDAQRDGDVIWSILAGSAVNHDGKSSGLTVPNGLAQQKVIKQAMAAANVNTSDISYIEAHGTGTKLGDPQEINALTNVFQKRDKKNSILIGSVKANIGHLESAAGVAGIIKVILGMNKRLMPKNIHLLSPNTLIPWDNTPLKPLTENHYFDSQDQLTCGISSFGISGTNSHVILQSPSSHPIPFKDVTHQKIPAISVFAAHSSESLKQSFKKMIQFLENTPYTLDEVAIATQRCTQHYAHRHAFIADSKLSLIQQLTYALTDSALTAGHPNSLISNQHHLDRGKIAFIFTGQGSQYINIASELYNVFPAFKKALTQCDNAFQPYLDESLIKLIFNNKKSDDLTNTLYAQPIIFSISYALVTLLKTFNITPDYVLGHSIGQFMAAYTAGVFSFNDAVHLVALRARAMSEVSEPGTMIAVQHSVSEIKEYLTQKYPSISIAAINSPTDITLSGSVKNIERLSTDFTQQKIRFQSLNVSHAFHSPLMKSALEIFGECLSQIKLSPPNIPIISDLTGQIATTEHHTEITTHEYWLKHIISTVNFNEALDTLIAKKCQAVVEIGGTATLSTFLTKKINSQYKPSFIPTLRGPQKSSLASFASMLTNYYICIGQVNWQALPVEYINKEINLPYYSFDTTAYPIHRTHLKNTINNSHSPQSLSQQDSSQKTANITSPPLKILENLIHTISGILINDDNSRKPFIALGFDSLMLTRLKASIQEKFDIEIPLADFYSKLNTYHQLISYLQLQPSFTTDSTQSKKESEIQADAISTPTESSKFSARSNNNLFSDHHLIPDGDTLQTLLSKQLDSFQSLCREQLNLFTQKPQNENMGSNKISLPHEQCQINQDFPKQISQMDSHNNRTRSCLRPKKPVTNFRLAKFTDDNLTEQQTRFIERLIKDYTAKTNKSKQFSINYNQDFSHYLTTLNFRKSLKNMLYPLVFSQAQGQYLWDIDNNPYLDLAMGYGVHFFGHKPEFVVKAVKKQLAEGFALSPHPELLGEVSGLIKTLTGVDRVSFCNTGSEAVMFALRIARTKTQRNKIVKFSGSYHGTYDAILAEQDEYGSYPTTDGITQSAVEDTIVLPYGDPQSLQLIREIGDELAAVLVEPVQSRNPSLQPKAFLKELRAITKELGAALIFDEVITGFRLHPAGAQGYFDIKADLVTYGKVIGGGLPIGIVAGTSYFMDSIDGGTWHYHDDSLPEQPVTFIAGTFANHPLALAAAKAVLEEIKQHSSIIYQQPHALTEKLAAQLNQYFHENKVPLCIKYCGPIFRFESFGRYSLALQPIEMDLFFYLLMLKGVYTWERRICFLSTLHTEADITFLVQAVIESISILRAGGFSFTVDEEPEPTPPNKKKVPSKDEALAVSKNTSSLSPVLMSSAQKRLYTLNKLQGANNTYHLPYIAAVRGNFNPKYIQLALNILAERHLSLTTTFHLEGDRFIRRTHPPSVKNIDLLNNNKKLLFLECAKTEKDNVNQEIQNFFRPFCLEKDPMLRAKLITHSPSEHTFLIDMHHIAADGFSANIIIKEFVKIYTSCSRQKASNFDIGLANLPTPLQFGDFVEWEQSYYKSNKFKRDQAFWQYQFADYKSTEELPLDFKRGKKQSFSGKTASFTLSKPQTMLLKKCASKHTVTPYMLLLSSCHILVRHLSQQNEIIIGTPVALRDQPDFETIVGMLTNTLVYRTHVDLAQSFPDFLTQIKQQCIEYYEHQAFPFEALINLLTTKREINRNPVFDISFVYEQADDREITIEGLQFTSQPIENIANNYDFSFEAIEQSEQLIINFHYNGELFKQETIQQWLKFTQALLNNIISNPDQSLYELVLNSQKKLPFSSLVQSNHLNNKVENKRQYWPPYTSLLERFSDVCSHNPHTKALQYGCKTFTYHQLDNTTSHFAHYLHTHFQLPTQSPIVILINQGDLLIQSLLSTQKINGIYVPIDPDTPTARIEYIINDCDAKLVITESVFLSTLQPITEKKHIPCCSIDSVIKSEWSQVSSSPITMPIDDKQEVISTIPAKQLAYIIYTSGTTGVPKGVKINQESLLNYFHWLTSKYQLSSSDSSLLLSSYAYDLGYTTLWGCLLSGACLHLMDKDERHNISYVIDYISHNQLTFLKLTPSLFHVLLQHPHFTSQLDWQLRLIFLGGEPLRANDVNEYFKIFKETQFVNHYGPTETTIGCIAHDFTINNFECYQGTCTIGKPIKNNHIVLLNSNNQLVSADEEGEICISGPCLASGYINQDSLTAEKFIPHPLTSDTQLYKTGDIGQWLNGRLYLKGRIDNQVKIRGYRVELDEISHTLEGHPNVIRAFTRSQSHTSGNELYTYYQLSAPSTSTELRTYLQNQLPEVMIPSFLHEVAEFKTNNNGKIDITSLPTVSQHLSKNPLPENKQGSPSQAITPLQETIYATWQHYLERTDINIEDNFFELGGHSIKAMLIAAALSKALAHDISINEIFNHPTILQLSQWIKANSTSSIKSPSPYITSSHIPSLPSQANYALSIAQRRLWLACQTQALNTAYNVHAAYQLTGEINITAFKHALNTLIERHEILRTNFIFTEGEPRQVVHDSIDPPLTILFESLPEPENNEQLHSYYQKEASYSFNLAAEPLFHITVFIDHLNKSHIMLFNAHHIICDGWSNAIFLKELSELYQCYQCSTAHTLSPLTIQGKEYAAWQNMLMTTSAAKQAKEFWQDYLQHAQPLSRLASPHSIESHTHCQAKMADNFIGKWCSTTIDQSLKEKIELYCQQHEVSLYTFFTAITSIFLAHHYGCHDVTLASPVADRQHPQLQNQIGFYLNTLLVRVKLDNKEPFATCLQSVKQNIQQILHNQFYPIDSILEDICSHKNQPLDNQTTQTPADFFNVLLNVMTYDHYSANTFGDLTFTKVLESSTTSRAHLNIMLIQSSSSIELAIEYSLKLFNEDDIKTIQHTLINLMNHCLEQPNQSIAEIKSSLISHQEKQSQTDFVNSMLAIDEVF
ncbi:hybrid non-ribosomal peptide synthetase/type I polyketide synthase [Zooshikella ganghwensis]|uniref:Hybrid non-ribosomal peptide synthetase/type I polyketide synthase n=1 Tax=Zooshikella ganghwensis TaxID=202772 RepID=A0A4V1INS1_9GAMM|nr:hybrid non-ribosomal peptide synthetase/type I polyketide synthase [Zooshikella ganghwensis]RDH44711.1 hybrid non-ribosomal peptide synthetase/type I polyketide synthase [Zooshikella ganghwensis]